MHALWSQNYATQATTLLMWRNTPTYPRPDGDWIFPGICTGYYRYEIQMLEIQIRALVSCCAVARAQLLGQKSRFAQQPQRGWLRAVQHEFFMRAKFFAAGEKKMKHLFFWIAVVWGGSPAAGWSLYQMGGGETHRGGLYGSLTTLSGKNTEDHLRMPPRSQDDLEGL